MYSTAYAKVHNLTLVVFKYSSKTCKKSSGTRALLTHCSIAVPCREHCMLVSEAELCKQIIIECLQATLVLRNIMQCALLDYTNAA